MTVGYSLHIRNLNAEAEPSSPGVTLGKYCINRAIPVTEIASEFGVTRATVYNWFCGATVPQSKIHPLIYEYMGEHETGQ